MLAVPKLTIPAASVRTLGATPVPIPGAMVGTPSTVLAHAIAEYGSQDDFWDFSASALCIVNSHGLIIATFGLTFASTVAFGVGYAPAAVINEHYDATTSNPWAVTTVIGTNPGFTGPMHTVAVQSGGLGYAIGDRSNVLGGTNNGVVQVATIGALGVVTSIQIFDSGHGYNTTSNPHNTTNATGTGAGLTVNVTQVDPPTQAIRLFTYALRFTP